MKKLKERWGITSNWQILIICFVFAITGSSSVYVAKPFLAWLGMDKKKKTKKKKAQTLYWVLRIL